MITIKDTDGIVQLKKMSEYNGIKTKRNEIEGRSRKTYANLKTQNNIHLTNLLLP